MNIGNDQMIYFPKKIYSSVRDSETLYYAADRGVVILVNPAGRDILEACHNGGTIKQIARKLSHGQKSAIPLIINLIKPFIQEMVMRRFLQIEETQYLKKDNSRWEDLSTNLNDLYLHVTYACNLKCIYCYNADQRTNGHKFVNGAQRTSSKYLRDQEIRCLIDEAAQIKVKDVIFTGGEPLLRKDVCKLAAYARNRGVSTTLMTNGTLIDQNLAKDILKSFDSVIISLDSCVKQENELLRPGAPFEKVIEGIQHLVREGMNSLVIRPVITKINLASLPQFPKFALNYLGCLQFLPCLCLPNNPEDLDTLNLLPAPGSYWSTLEDFYLALEKIGGISINDCIPVEASGSCGAGAGVLSLAPNGDVFPCQCLHYDEFKFGNVKDKSLFEIINNSNAMAKFHEESWPWFRQCSECVLLRLCSSTCRVFFKAFKKNEELFFSRLCPFFKKEIENKLWQEAKKLKDSVSESIKLSDSL